MGDLWQNFRENAFRRRLGDSVRDAKTGRYEQGGWRLGLRVVIKGREREPEFDDGHLFVEINLKPKVNVVGCLRCQPLLEQSEFAVYFDQTTLRKQALP